MNTIMSKSIQTRNVSFLLLMLVLTSGCVTDNYVATYYQDDLVGVPEKNIAARVMPYSGSTRIANSSNMQKDYTELLRRNLVPIGHSAFTARNVKDINKMILSHANKIEADYVLYSTEFVRSEQGTRPVLNYNPGTTSTTNTYGNVNANAYGSGGYAYGTANYSGTSTTTTPGTMSVSHVSATYRRYQYEAHFFRFGRPVIFGVYYNNLSDELRKKLGRNTGVLVTLVFFDTPAFRSNFFSGDVIIAINDNEVFSPAEFGSLLGRFAGRKCSIKVLRDGETLSIPVQLNSPS